MSVSTLEGLGFRPGHTIEEQAQRLNLSAAEIGRATGLRTDLALSPRDLARAFQYNSSGPELVAIRDPKDQTRNLGSPTNTLSAAREMVTARQNDRIEKFRETFQVRLEEAIKCGQSTVDVGSITTESGLFSSNVLVPIVASIPILRDVHRMLFRPRMTDEMRWVRDQGFKLEWEVRPFELFSLLWQAKAVIPYK